jgi:hypothetical protein
MTVPGILRRKTAGWALTALLITGCAGGSGGARIEAPRLDPAEAARHALAEYDTNRDGVLDAAELERCPALKNSLSVIDRDGDGRLSADDIADRLRAYGENKVGLLAVTCQVTLDGQPLEGATVTFVPEKFMGPNFKRALATTDASGTAQPTVEGDPLPGVPYGCYRIEVSKKNGAGKETLAPRYHSETVLGQEVGPKLPALRGTLMLPLTSQ